jgi:hypothetical protein
LPALDRPAEILTRNQTIKLGGFSTMRSIVSIGLFVVAALWAITSQAGENPEAILYKTPNCGCCEGHADYLRRYGYKVTVKPSHNMPQIKKLAGVPTSLEGCHTIKISGYVVEGHVPANVLDKLLSERPKIKGISLPGMPQGSPGMSGHKSAPFAIYEIDSSVTPKVYVVE